MRPAKFAPGEMLHSEFAYRVRHAFDHFYFIPTKNFKFHLTAKLPKDDYSDLVPFGNGALLKSIGNFVVNINRVLDPENQIAVHIPDKAGRKVHVHGDNILTVQHVRDTVETILEAYAENRHRDDFTPHALVAPAYTRAKRYIDCMKAFALVTDAPIRQPASSSAIPADILMARYMGGVDLAALNYPVRETAFDSFDLDYGLKNIRPSEFDKSEENNGRCNRLYFADEKEDNVQSLQARSREWNPLYFEGGKADYLQRLKAFLKSELSVTLTVSDYAYTRIELRGSSDHVKLAKRIGIRAVPLLNAGEPISGRDGRPGKPLDKEWLENALCDARRHFALQRICGGLGVIPNAEALKPSRRRAEPKHYPEFRFAATFPA